VYEVLKQYKDHTEEQRWAPRGNDHVAILLPDTLQRCSNQGLELRRHVAYVLACFRYMRITVGPHAKDVQAVQSTLHHSMDTSGSSTNIIHNRLVEARADCPIVLRNCAARSRSCTPCALLRSVVDIVEREHNQTSFGPKTSCHKH
jgi:hypothetical protein